MSSLYGGNVKTSIANVKAEAEAEIRRIEHEIDEFCECCEFRRDFGGYEDCGGARVYIPDWTCPADMDPTDLGCRRYEEYKELTDRRAELDGLIFPSYRSETEQKYKEEKERMEQIRKDEMCKEYAKCVQNCLSSSSERRMRELENEAAKNGLRFEMTNRAAYNQPRALVAPKFDLKVV